MGKNTKPMLTVLVEGDKLQQFRDYALSKEVSMGWVVNRLLDRVLSGELDVMGDSPSIEKARGYVENTSTGLTKEDVESMIKSSIDNQLTSSTRDYIEKTIKSYIDSLGVSSTGTNDIEEVTRASIEVALEPIKESVSKLEAEARAISDRSVVTESIAPIEDPSISMLKHPSELPVWVNTNLKRFYLMLVGKPELIAKVAEEVERYPSDNSILGIKLKNLGLHKDNGHAFKDECSRIRTVVNRLKTTAEPTLPLFSTND